MTEKIDYGSRKPGDFMSIGNTPNDFIDRPKEDQVFLAARSHLCPVPDEVITAYSEDYAQSHPDITDPNIIRLEGMKMAISRYSECNFAMKRIILPSVKETNLSLYKKLITPVARLPQELPDSSLKEKYLPKDFKEKMRLASTVYGYALPRILIAQFGENRTENDARSQERMLKGLLLIDTLAPNYNNPVELTVALAEEVCRLDADPRRVIYHLFSTGILKEEGCKTMFKEVFDTMNSNSKILKQTYEDMLDENGEEGLHGMGIIAPSDLK